MRYRVPAAVSIAAETRWDETRRRRPLVRGGYGDVDLSAAAQAPKWKPILGCCITPARNIRSLPFIDIAPVESHVFRKGATPRCLPWAALPSLSRVAEHSPERLRTSQQGGRQGEAEAKRAPRQRGPGRLALARSRFALNCGLWTDTAFHLDFRNRPMALRWKRPGGPWCLGFSVFGRS